MAPLPIEILASNAFVAGRLERALQVANNVQTEFQYIRCRNSNLVDAVQFAPTTKINTMELMDQLDAIRIKSRGYHPFIILFVEAFLSGEIYENLFANGRHTRGIAIVTFYEVPVIVGADDDSLTGYALYYIARFSMGFSAPTVRTHDASRQCLYDQKVQKAEIIDSFRSGAICDVCKNAIWESGKGTSEQMSAVNRLLEHASSLVHKTKIRKRPTVFIGSSSKNIAFAKSFRDQLAAEFQVQVWDEDQVFRLGAATIEQLEQHVSFYEFGVFFMLPDDRLLRGEREFPVPRDNVVFEAGLFTGKLTRNRTIIITVAENFVTLPSDLNGLTTLRFSLDDPLPHGLAEAARKASKHMRFIAGEGGV